MATFRVGVGSFNIQDGAVGFGTDTDGLGNLKVKGVTKTTGSIVSGASTLTRYSGFAADNINQLENITLTSEVGTIGDIVVGVGTSVIISSGSTVTVGTVESVSIGTHFSPPKGGIEERGEDFVEGMMRFNTDLNTMEFYNGSEWRQFTYISDVQNSPLGRGRGLSGGGSDVDGNNTANIDFINMSSQGSSQNFGDRTISANNASACSSATRGLFCGGGTPGGNNTIDYVTIASEGNAIDFGDRTSKQFSSGSCGSSTRGLTGGGNPASNIIDYHQFSTLGDSIDFGDLNATQYGVGSASSPVSGFWVGGTNLDGKIQKVTIASTGNAIDFGFITGGVKNGRSCSNNIQLFYGGGENEGTGKSIDKFIMSSGGNAIHFGDLTVSSLEFSSSFSNQTRGFWAQGRTPSARKTIDKIEMSTEGNSSNFGDMTFVKQKCCGLSDSHGGLGGY